MPILTTDPSFFGSVSAARELCEYGQRPRVRYGYHVCCVQSFAVETLGIERRHQGESNEGKDIANCGRVLASAAHSRVLCKPDASGGASGAAGRPRTTR